MMKTEIIDQTEIVYDDSKESDTVTVITSDTGPDPGPRWDLCAGEVYQFMDKLLHEENNRED